MTNIVSSPANPLVKRVRALAQRKHRQREGVTVVHGAQAVRQAVEAGVELETLIVAPALVGTATSAFVDEQRAAGVRVVDVTAAVFERIAEGIRPSGIAAVVPTDLREVDDLVGPTGRATVVALDRVANPGNLGTILRTAAATGADGVVLIGPSADPYDPAAVKASMGAIFTVGVARLPDVEAFLRWARSRELAVVTTSGTLGTSGLWDVRFPPRSALLLGTEGDGLADDVVARGDLQVAIPMVGTAESLNLAVAAGVLMYERWRQLG